MKQIVQDLNSGQTILEVVPTPEVRRGCVLIRTHRTLVSLGTERMLVEFGKAGWINKARQQPEKVLQVIQKIKTDGLKPTMDAVFRKLGEPLPLGYCNAGEVIAVGVGVNDFKVGDRVISNGNHAEVVCVPNNLVAKIPDGVSYDEAAFTVIGAIGLQGLRLIQPTFGETVVVTGLGLIGLIAAQLLQANGCRVIGLDFDGSKVELAKELGLEAVKIDPNSDPANIILSMTNNIGADAVLITASAKSNDVISQAAKMCRKRGRIVLVGVIGLDIQRADFYEKELTFQVSCSYGPGRYEEEYEQKGMDYPIGFVRWTEQRNFEAVLQAISKKSVNVNALITEIVDLENYQEIYGDMGNSKSIASILKYNVDGPWGSTKVNVGEQLFVKSVGTSGIIGAGNFAGAMIVPLLKELNANIKYIASAKGLSGTTLAKKYKIPFSTSRYQDILEDVDVDAVVITTRHGAHASQVIESLNAGKHVFVEKPLALTLDEIETIKSAVEKSGKIVTVGFNRRFSPFSIAAKELLHDNTPIQIIATMNAGFIPDNSWVHDMESGGGRIIGEACHYIDLISFFAGSQVEKVIMNAMGKNTTSNTDNASILLKYKNGSSGVINYFSNGSKSYPKEKIEIYSQQKNILIDNFRSAEFFGYSKSKMKKTQDKGHKEQFTKWNELLKNGGQSLISFDEIYNTSRAAILAVESLKTGMWMEV
ncbi:bi-domain-containing oxidoreductase [Candidatus Dojkabacteria bacterium]|jgi:predicted dehydrogenase/threonine dehydrogenase-like Zn-dependent dehydrogenase|nr:bi-domain-containing oxidoreductase [Saprospiraceae bacterium]MBP9758321.1 bi-domain-containing oxidoreductase [Candidatus Dojkabacteria bacterium]